MSYKFLDTMSVPELKSEYRRCRRLSGMSPEIFKSRALEEAMTIVKCRREIYEELNKQDYFKNSKRRRPKYVLSQRDLVEAAYLVLDSEGMT